MRPPRRAVAGERLSPRRVISTDGLNIEIPDPAGLVHLRFQRYAGCPVCATHLRAFGTRSGEIAAASVRVVVVLPSTPDRVRRAYPGLPFAMVADPDRRLFDEFAVGSSIRALTTPKVVVAAGCGLTRAVLTRTLLQTAGLSQPHRGLPADLLVNGDGTVLSASYGRHAADQWTVPDLFEHVRRTTGRPVPGT